MSEDRLKYRLDSSDIDIAAMNEFGAGCLETCAIECMTVKYSFIMTKNTFNSSENETNLYYRNIGGALGVFIGLNILSMVKLVEFFVETLYIFC